MDSEHVPVKRFVTNLRVLVKKDEDGKEINAVGMVTRICSDGESAWILIEAGMRNAKVRAFPEDCELAETSIQEQREARRKSGEPMATLESFGKDHWTTFMYLEMCCVEHKGLPDDLRRMRCDPKRHPLLAHADLLGVLHDGGKYPTRLKGGVELQDHDDWDCAADLEAVGLIENIGSGAYPRFRMTTEGNRMASLLRVYKQHGGRYAEFSPGWSPPADADPVPVVLRD
jgi:hypothetical protein